MNPTVRPDFVSFDEPRQEYVLYFVEDGPWPNRSESWRGLLTALQGRILDAVDAALDGGLAQAYPESIGQLVRIQVDSPSGEPQQVRELVNLVRQYLYEDPSYRAAIAGSAFVKGIRIVTGHELGRFQQAEGPVPREGPSPE